MSQTISIVIAVVFVFGANGAHRVQFAIEDVWVGSKEPNRVAVIAQLCP